MKKFFAFVVAMAMTVAANAAVYTLAVPSQVVVGTTGAIVVECDGHGTSGDFNVAIVGNTVAKFTGVGQTGVGSMPGAKGITYYGFDANFNEDLWECLTSAPVTSSPAAGPAVTLEFAALALGSFDVILYSDSFEEVSRSSVSVVTPEPMTMSLLALGGLFAARRRRA